jgi:hypothetical protein
MSFNILCASYRIHRVCSYLTANHRSIVLIRRTRQPNLCLTLIRKALASPTVSPILTLYLREARGPACPGKIPLMVSNQRQSRQKTIPIPRQPQMKTSQVATTKHLPILVPQQLHQLPIVHLHHSPLMYFRALYVVRLTPYLVPKLRQDALGSHG